MMQNVTQDEDHDSNKELRTVEIEQGSPTGPSYPSPLPLDKTQPLPTSQSTFGQDIFTSDDDEISDVASYLAEQDIEDDVDDQDLEPSTFLLPTEGMEASNLPSIDPETHARLEALLEAAGIGKLSTADGKALTDPEVLRKLTSSVSCALDEAAQALHRMRAEQQGQLGVIEGSRSLAEACSDGDVPTVRKLLHEGGSVHETTEEGESLLSLACSAGYYELAQVLLAMKANVEDRGIKGDCTPLMEAASGGYVDIVKLLITHGADVNAQSSAGNTPLHYAACGGYEDVVQVLIDAGANVEQHNENGHTPLMESASAGHVGVARILLSSGAGINTHSNEFKESALTLACYKGHLEMVKFLLEAGADQEHKTDEMHTALMEASMDGHVEVARLLLDSGAQVNMPADSFESPLTLAACGGHVDLASLLIERGANLEEVNDEGYTPLMEAAREGHEEMVALLLAHGADINAQTEETQETALTLACCGGFLEVADFLIKAGADIELGCSTPLMEAAQEGHLELVRYLLKAGANVRAQTGTGDTALTYACENGHTDVAEVLLQHGADLEHESEGGRTPLMKAARAGHLCTVQFLISKGADVNRQTSTNDHTVLSLACAGGHLAVVELMLAHGGDPAHKLKDGSTMIIEAAKGGHTQVVKLLLEYPNRVLMNSSPDLAQLTDPHLSEARVPVHGLANIVPPSDPDSTPSTNFTPNIQPGATTKKQGEKDINIPVRTQEVWKNVQKNIGKRPHNGNGETVVKTSKSNVPLPPSDVTANNAQYQYGEIGSLPDLIPEETLDVKARERLEAIINNVMDKELDNTSTKEEQILRKQQILQELQKVERELQEKAQAQLLISAQHQREQQQQQQHLQQVLQQGAKVLQRTLEVQVKRKQDESPADGQSAEDQDNQDLVESSQGSNDLDKQVTSLFAPDGSTVGQIVFPNIPYDGLLPVTPSQTPQPGTEVVMEGNKESWARNNGNVPVKRNANKAGTRGSGGMKVSNTTTATTTTTTATSVSQVNGVANIDQGLPQQAAPGMQQTAGNGNSTLALYRQQIQNIQAVRQQQQLTAPQVQQQHTQTIQFPQLQLTPEQQEQLLQMLSQQTLPGQPLAPQPLAQQQFLQQPALPQTGVQLLPPPQPQGAPPAGQAQQTQVVPSPAATAAALTQQQYLTQQQQQQLLQQQQQAQLLQQQLQQQIKPPQPAPPAVAVPKNARKQRNLYNTQTVLQPGTVLSPGSGSLENITPPPSTPLTPNPSPASPQSISPLCAPIDLDAQTESNHDTALTLACHGGHSELVNLLLSKGADIEHRDKKGFTPLILAATAGHVDVVEILLDHGADMEAQSERTKDTPLSLACSGGRYEVVELLLGRGANKEHRNVSDYTPLSLAASGGYVNIIKLLLSHGAEINSRTGSKLGISPLMLAAMNGHTPAVKLLLDMGSDINAQIETNRNTALTLACFQGRHEVVSLLVDRKANIEHRAKTGLTPLMEAASGGYVEVGRVLLDKGADVNAPPVPSSRDTALTIAADKGHYRFVELLLLRGAAVDVKNKKGNSPLWLACNGGHLDVVQLLVSAKADIDSQDNRKVTCLMASFRKGHIKVVKWMVKHVNQFPSDQELARYISTVGDKELQKKCQQCKEIIVSAKDRQAAEANKNATILLEELDKERQHEENRKAAAAKKRERKKAKKREKQQEKEKETEDDCLVNCSVDDSKNSSPEPECNSVEENPGSEDSNDVEDIVMEPPTATIVSTIGIALPTTNTEPKFSKVNRMKPTTNTNNKVESGKVTSTESKKNKRNREKRERYPDVENMPIPTMSSGDITTTTTTITVRPSPGRTNNRNSTATRKKKGERDQVKNASTGIGDLDDFGTLPENMKISDRELERMKKTGGKVKSSGSDTDNKKHHHSHPMSDKGNVEVSTTPSNLAVKTSPLVNSPKKGQKKEEGWKEVTRKKSSTAPDVKGPTGRDRSKKVQVPSAAISRVIGRAGCNINAIREVSGAHIEVEKQRGSGERVITIKGSADATRQAHTLISALVSDPDKDLQEIIPKLKIKPSSSSKDQSIYFSVDPTSTALGTISNNIMNPASQGLGQKSIGNWIPMRSQPGSVTSAGMTGVSNGVLRLSGVSMANPPSGGGIVWGNTPPQNIISSPRRNQSKQSPAGAAFPSPVGIGSDKTAMRQLFPNENKKGGGFGSPSQTSSNTTVTYSLASTSTAKVTTSASTFVVKSDNGKSSNGGKSLHGRQPGPGSIKVLQRPASQKQDPLPIISNQQVVNSGMPVTSIDGHPVMPSNGNGMPGFSPFNNAFSNVAEQVLGNKKDDIAERMNFASVAAAGVVSSMVNSNSPTPDMLKSDASLQAKAPGYRVSGSKPLTQQDLADPTNNPMFIGGFPQNLADLEAARTPGYRGNMPNQSPSMSPRSGSSTSGGLSPRGQHMMMMDPNQLSMGSIPSLSSQKDEYSTPSQPMTLPKIESTLNPNAPNFTSRQPGQLNHQGPNVPSPQFPLGYIQSLYQQALAQQLIQQAAPGKPAPGGIGGPNPGIVPSNMISQQDFANLIHQFVASGQAQAPGGPPSVPGGPPPPAPVGMGVPGARPQNPPQRPFSPLPPQARPSSAPSIGGMPKDGPSPGPIGPPPSATSPMAAATPPLQEQMKGDQERRPPRPVGAIGGERAQRRAPGAGVTGGGGPDYGKFWNLASELSMQWNHGSTSGMTPVQSTPPTSSSVMNRSNMSSTQGPSHAEERVGPSPMQNHTDYMEARGDMTEPGMDKTLPNQNMSSMPFFGKGMDGGHFPIQPTSFSPGPVGDAMWNPQVKGQVPETSDKMWNSWSSQTSM